MKLTENFSKHEFDSKDVAEMPDEILECVKRLANYLQVIRDFVEVPITINSGYRSPEHNESVGGKENSYHLKGMAADIVINRYTPDQVFYLIEQLTHEGKLPKGGMKAYSTFTHWDFRGWNARW